MAVLGTLARTWSNPVAGCYCGLLLRDAPSRCQTTAMLMRNVAGFAVCVAITGCATAEAPTGNPDARATDAQRDARVDARPSIDAPVIPDAPPDACAPRLRQLLVNPNFDLAPVGMGWTQTPATIIRVPPTGITPPSVANVAWFGGASNANDVLSQDIVVPATATSFEVVGKRLIGSEELLATPYDTLAITVQTTAGATLATLASLSNVDKNPSAAFMPFAFAAPMPFAGQTVRLHFRARTDGSFNTNFFFDDLAVNVTACP